jgi:hypothetical protein
MNIHTNTMVETSVPEREIDSDRDRGREGVRESRVYREFAAALMAVDDGQCVYIYIYTLPLTLASPPKFNWPVDDKNLSMPINRREVTLEVY